MYIDISVLISVVKGCTLVGTRNKSSAKEIKLLATIPLVETVLDLYEKNCARRQKCLQAKTIY
jgi:hypothetical protein